MDGGGGGGGESFTGDESFETTIANTLLRLCDVTNGSVEHQKRRKQQQQRQEDRASSSSSSSSSSSHGVGSSASDLISGHRDILVLRSVVDSLLSV